MENKLKSIFEYQRFENNSRLAGIIAGVEDRFAAVELADEELLLVNAAGITEQKLPDTEKDK